MISLAKYVNLEILHVSTNYSKESKPWCDTCLVAKKDVSFNKVDNTIEKRIENLDSKLNEILKKSAR